MGRKIECVDEDGEVIENVAEEQWRRDGLQEK
jgi:hypothetical protein